MNMKFWVILIAKHRALEDMKKHFKTIFGNKLVLWNSKLAQFIRIKRLAERKMMVILVKAIG